MNVLYFESHVTISPVFDERLERFKEICSKHGFRVAKLLMEKHRSKTFEISNHDSFCTGRSDDEDDLKKRMVELCKELRSNQFEVLRYKIEAVTLDSRKNDVFELLS